MSELPSYSAFRSACQSGLSIVRPLRENARAHDQYGWNYGSGWPPSYAAFGRMRVLATLRQALALRPRRVLEVAAGDGSLSACLAAQGVTVFANDLRAEDLREALANFANADKVNLLPGNFLALSPEQSGLFDLVIACEVIEHVAHPDDFLLHLKRFLAPFGHILLTTPNGSYFRNRLPTLSEIGDPATLEARQFRPDADGHLFLITPAQLSAIAAQAGLRVEKIDLCATPFITGHCRLSHLHGEWMTGVCYSLEKLCRHLPRALVEKICCSMMAVLQIETTGTG
jgi:2-polyprenyl-3-methyl-5-hydroxy-6-metoxy-1,4-benzoquinol methylase